MPSFFVRRPSPPPLQGGSAPYVTGVENHGPEPRGRPSPSSSRRNYDNCRSARPVPPPPPPTNAPREELRRITSHIKKLPSAHPNRIRFPLITATLLLNVPLRRGINVCAVTATVTTPHFSGFIQFPKTIASHQDPHKSPGYVRESRKWRQVCVFVYPEPRNFGANAETCARGGLLI
ncbi:hypothetical protein GEV33_013671 [Tenebrio molitor]|uniref:Uncharacterized protein n=1 Tax=Tenebrio molitor TaxID=7067 RepID=A0A8J6H843_TENMO|nr:hypothetical protein GEV33_013671 [Tenebrio molitor]